MGLGKNNTDLEEIRESVTNVENISTEVKTGVNEVKTDTEGIVLSNESIKAIVDEIQNRIGLTGDTGGSASAGSVMSKLNQIIGSTGSGGGITGFKYINKTGRFSYTTRASGIIFGRGYNPKENFTLTNAYIGIVFQNTSGDISEKTPYIFGAFTKNAVIASSANTNETHIFEFI